MIIHTASQLAIITNAGSNSGSNTFFLKQRKREKVLQNSSSNTFLLKQRKREKGVAKFEFQHLFT